MFCCGLLLSFSFSHLKSFALCSIIALKYLQNNKLSLKKCDKGNKCIVFLCLHLKSFPSTLKFSLAIAAATNIFYWDAKVSGIKSQVCFRTISGLKNHGNWYIFLFCFSPLRSRFFFWLFFGWFWFFFQFGNNSVFSYPGSVCNSLKGFPLTSSH